MVVLCPAQAILEAFFFIIWCQIHRKSSPQVLVLYVGLDDLLADFELRLHQRVFLQVNVEEFATRHNFDTVAQIFVEQVIRALHILLHAFEYLEYLLLRRHPRVVDCLHFKLVLINLCRRVPFMDWNILDIRNTTTQILLSSHFIFETNLADVDFIDTSEYLN